MRINREHKDRLFKFIFEKKENLLQLYNALNGTNYNNPEDLEIVTLEDVIYMRMKNDIAFVLDYRMNLFEHQSTDNPNMPLRGFLYFARQYEKYIAVNEYNLFSTRLISLPTPQYVVFYNGDRWKGERKILKLSDCFANNEIKACMEIEVIQLNINYGHNKEIMEKCQILGEYAVFVGKVKNYNKTLSIEDAVDRATDECIEEGILKDILIEHRAEVKDMLLTEYDEEKTMRLFQKEYEEEAAEKVARAEEEVAKANKRAEMEVAKAKAEVAKAKAEVAKAKEEVAKAEEKAVKAEEKAAQAEEKAAQVSKQVKDMEKLIKQMQMEMKEFRGN